MIFAFDRVKMRSTALLAFFFNLPWNFQLQAFSVYSIERHSNRQFKIPRQNRNDLSKGRLMKFKRWLIQVPATQDFKMQMTTTTTNKEQLRNEVKEALKGWPELCRRWWIPVSSSIQLGNQHEFRFTVMQWNTLSDGLSGLHPNRGGFILAPFESLEWKHRRYRILEEILRWETDIICLQEVDHYHDWFFPKLRLLGYAGIFAQKPASAGLRYCSLEDGCAIFYKKEKFELNTCSTVIYNQRMTDGSAAATNQVGLVALLDFKQEPNCPSSVQSLCETSIIVSTTHLAANKNQQGEAIRTLQAAQLLNTITRTTDSSTQKDKNACQNVVLCGDLNATPEHQKTYRATCYSLCRSHSLGLSSVYQQHCQLLNSGYVYTTWKVRPNLDGTEHHVKHCIDYILASQTIQTTALASIPTNNDGIDSNFTPSFCYPSDHFALVAELSITNSKSLI